MTARLVLAAMGILLLGYAVRGVTRGEITVKGVTARRDAEPAKFWFSVAVVGAFGAMLVAFSLFGRLEAG
ncbi:MAG: hypothetical protein D6739_10820 [Nitrospirae bacterium]|nr:MAG: hypothetical protein D6739_10820 [Nitrospirota bacterium]